MVHTKQMKITAILITGLLAHAAHASETTLAGFRSEKSTAAELKREIVAPVVSANASRFQSESLYQINAAGVWGGVLVGTAATVVNESTLSGKLRTARKAMQSMQVDMKLASTALDKPEVLQKLKEQLLKESKTLAQNSNFSIVRRSVPFRTGVFLLPSWVTYNVIKANPDLRRSIASGLNNIVDFSTACKNMVDAKFFARRA